VCVCVCVCVAGHGFKWLRGTMMAKSTPMPMTVVSIPDLTSIFSTIISDRSRKKKESTSTENTCVRISPATAKATSTKVDPSVMISIPRSRMASLNALVSKAGATKLSLLSTPSSASRRAVAMPKT